MQECSISENPSSSLTTNEPSSSLGKRSISRMSDVTDSSSPSKFPSCIKGTSTNRLVMKRVTFHPDLIVADTFEISGLEAEKKYFTALYTGRHGVADSMRKQGLMLSDSNLCYIYVNAILRSSKDVYRVIDYLLKNQPHVFSQIYECGKNVFFSATQTNINYILSSTSSQGLRSMIFKEVLRNPFLRLEDDFYREARPNRACEMIELTESSGRTDIIGKCYLLPKSLAYYNLNGDTFFTEAVKNKNLNRISWLIIRADAAEFILMTNADGHNCIDLAIDLFDKDQDPEYSVMLSLFPVISSLYRLGDIYKLEDLVEEFISHITEADNNGILLKGLREEFQKAKAYALINNFEGLTEDFVGFIEKQLEELRIIDDYQSSEESDESSGVYEVVDDFDSAERNK